MRLGQISRKLNLRPIQIRDFIRDKFQVEIDTDLNTKLEDSYIDALQKKFVATGEVAGASDSAKATLDKDASVDENDNQSDRWSKKAAELIKAKKEAAANIATEEPVAEKANTEEISVAPVANEIKSEIAETVSAEKSESIILSDNKPADGLDPFTPRRVDPEAELIKAQNIKLDGPKVVGKIVLPPSKKELEAKAAAEAAAIAAELAAVASDSAKATSDREAGIDSSVEVSAEGELENEIPKISIEEGVAASEQIIEKKIIPKVVGTNPISKKIADLQVADSDEEWSPFKDKNGIYHFSREQKDNRKKSLERIRSGQKDEVKKRAKSSHYQQNFKPEPKELVAKKKEKKETVSKKVKEAAKPERKGIWGKFRNWLDG